VLIILVLILIFLFFSVRGGDESEVMKIVRQYNYEPLYSRQLPEERIKYRNNMRKTIYNFSIKAGQRKLFLSELEFLCANPDTDVLYIGAAPGIHIVGLLKLFPNITFHLYDPRDFFDGLREYKNAKIYQKYFDLKDAEKYKNLLLFSDIRTGETLGNIESDMALQKEWCEMVQPKMALLKFRLPFTEGKTTYFSGKIYTQPHIGLKAMEIKLWTDCKTYTNWDHYEINDKILKWALEHRPAYHEFDILPGMDHCHDCWSTVQIIEMYLRQRADSAPQNARAMLQFIDAHTFSTLKVHPHDLCVEERDFPTRFKKNYDAWLKFGSSNKIKYDNFASQKQETYSSQKWLTEVYKNSIIQTLLNPPKKFLMSTAEAKKIAKKYRGEEKKFMVYRNRFLTENIPREPVRPLREHELVNHNDGLMRDTLLLYEFIKTHNIKTIILYFYIIFPWGLNDLVDAFPDTKFIVYSPNFSYPTKDNMIYFKKILTNLECTALAKLYPQSHLFMDIKINGTSDEIKKIQKNFCQILKPVKAMLMIPFDGNEPFYDGDLLAPIWTVPNMGTPLYTFLITDCTRVKQWDNQAWQERLFYFYIYCVFPQGPEKRKAPLDDCFNCWRGSKILGDVDLQINWMREKSESIIKFCPHGYLPNEKNNLLRQIRLIYYVHMSTIARAHIYSISVLGYSPINYITYKFSDYIK
jgi:hypothetical protein